MKKSDRVYILSCTFSAATALFYCSVRWFKIKLPRYYPVEHVWKTAKEPGVPSQLWFAMQTYAFICAAIVTLVVYFILKSRKQSEDLKPSTVKSMGLATAAVVTFCLAYIVWFEFSHWGIL